MKSNTRYELRPHGITESWTGYFEDNFYYEHGVEDEVILVGKLEGNSFYYGSRPEPSGTLEGLTLTRSSDGVSFELIEVNT
jgi:hypothetical protein